MRLSAFLVALMVVIGRPAAADPAFDLLVEAAMAKWQVPGLALAAVQGDRVVVQGVYGLRDVERGLPVTAKTRFALGSVTKTVTATGLALLAGQGRVDWDRPVSQIWPAFALADPKASAAITARDLMTHRSGLPRHDVLWYAEAFDRPELVRRLRYLRPTRAVGEAFQYNNLMVMAAGALAGRIAGSSWEAFIATELFAPLGMTGAGLSLADFQAAPDRAEAYFPGAAGRIRIEPRDTDQIAPAAALGADLEDITRYLYFLLARGRVGDRQLVAETAIEDLWRLQVPFEPSGEADGYRPLGYGTGFYIADYRGHRVVRHGGVIDGYAAELFLVPAADLGIVVLSNLSGSNPVPRLIARTLADRLLGLPPKDWLGQAELRASPTAPEPPPPAPLDRPPAAYAGRYLHPAYGVLAVTPDDSGQGLAGRFHDIAFRLSYLGKDRWRVVETAWPLRADLIMSFETDPAGRVARLVTPIADVPSEAINPGDMTFQKLLE